MSTKVEDESEYVIYLPDYCCMIRCSNENCHGLDECDDEFIKTALRVMDERETWVEQ